MPGFFGSIRRLFNRGSRGAEGNTQPEPQELPIPLEEGTGTGEQAATRPAPSMRPPPVPPARGTEPASMDPAISPYRRDPGPSSLPEQAEDALSEIREVVDELAQLKDDGTGPGLKGKALNALSRLKQWCQESAAGDTEPAEDTRQCVEQLWQLLALYRRRKWYVDAVYIWRLLLGMTGESHPEVVRLAGAMAEEYRVNREFRSGPAGLCTFGVVADALCVTGAALPAELARTFGDLFDTFKIDWTTQHKVALENLRLIKQVLTLLRHFPNEFMPRLRFWWALGRWQWDDKADPEWLYGQFRYLSENGSTDREERQLYRWCQARVRFDRDVRVDRSLHQWQVELVHDEVRRWDASLIGTSPEELARQLVPFFKGLTLCEHGLSMRHGKINFLEDDILWADAQLSQRPAVVERCERLTNHLAPVLTQVRRLADAYRQHNRRPGNQ